MNAIILAAGRGSRLGPLTDERPKCLTPLAGKPLLEWQLDALRAAGIDRLGVVRGYQGQLLGRPDLFAFENPRWEQTNMVRSLCCADAWLAAAPCIVSYGDIVYSADAVARLAVSPGDIAITFDTNWLALWSARFANPLSDAETFRIDDAGRLVEIGGRPSDLAEVQGQYMGLLKFTPVGWAAVTAHLGALAPAAVDQLDMTSLLRGLLAAGHRIDTVPVSDRWFEVDTASDLVLYESLLHGKPRL